MTALVQIGNLGRGLLGLLTALGLVALAALVVHESNAAEPVLPFRLWRNREVALCNFASLALGAIVISVGGFLPTYVQGVMGYSPSVAGIAFGATSIAWAFASFLAASIMIRTSFRASATIGGAAILAGNAILVAMTPSSGALWAATGAFVIGFGLGFCNTTYLVAVQAAATRSERGAVTSSNLFMRIVGQSVGAAIFGAVINIGIASYDPHLASLAERLMDPGIRGTFHGGDLAHLSATLGLALRNVYVIAALIGVAMLILGLRFPARPPTDDPA
jgi:Na+/melibiose symporter-like transporter